MLYDVVTSPSVVLRICRGVLRDVTVLEPHVGNACARQRDAHSRQPRTGWGPRRWRRENEKFTHVLGIEAACSPHLNYRVPTLRVDPAAVRLMS